jgi:DTW domain-containing protein YfiP
MNGHRGRTGASHRCGQCGLHLRLCLCAEAEPLELATRVVVVSSTRELSQPTNTGRLVPLALLGSEVRARGQELGCAGGGCDAAPERRTWLLFPAPDSRELVPADAGGPPVTLVVPDGTWRAARRMAAREPALARLPRVRLPDGPPSRYRLRSHPDPRCLATFEAVARALGILEGRAVGERLMRLFTLFVERTLFARGRLHAASVTGGIPRSSEQQRGEASTPALRVGARTGGR